MKAIFAVSLAAALSVFAFGRGAEAMPFTFTDDFTPSASPLWSSTTGNWTASGGDYYAQQPNNDPEAVSLLPFQFSTSDLLVTVTVNNLGDGGIVLVAGSDFIQPHGGPPGSGAGFVQVVLGGQGYGMGGRGAIPGTTISWSSDLPGTLPNLIDGVFTPGDTYVISTLVNGDVFEAYLDPDGVFDASSVLLDSFTAPEDLGTVEVGLYDDQPGPPGGFGAPTSFSDFSVTGTVLPEPTSFALFIGGLVGLGFLRRRQRFVKSQIAI